eukprot:TRINITY_DN26744_c0_g1_i3.p1 TRINITY_DN26744_c0_g1~~TRINITY_DN26744_c0_g1_i3.p1  ORF type:complete len:749 (+),score=164.58 TRINITY_DN26744_c0_g1_i3:185-2431(+)
MKPQNSSNPAKKGLAKVSVRPASKIANETKPKMSTHTMKNEKVKETLSEENPGKQIRVSKRQGGIGKSAEEKGVTTEPPGDKSGISGSEAQTKEANTEGEKDAKDFEGVAQNKKNKANFKISMPNISSVEEFEPGKSDEKCKDIKDFKGGDECTHEEEYGRGLEGVEQDDDDDEDIEDGVEEEEHDIEVPASVQERTKMKELEVFVGGLDKKAVEEDLKEVFSQVGPVKEVRLLRAPGTKKNKGYAFVRFSTKEEAKHAVNELNGVVIRGKKCSVAASEDNDTLFLGNICNTWTKEAVKERLKFYGVEGLDELTLVADSQNEGLSRGFAFLSFSTHTDAIRAYKRLQKPDVLFGGSRTAKVAFAEPLREPDKEIMAKVKSVFIDGIPPYWDEDRVRNYLKRYGEIERVVLARNMPTAKRKDFGFVNFRTHEEAMACIDGLNNTMIIDGETKMKVRIRLANPLPKRQAVKGGMRGGFPLGYSGIGLHTRGRGIRAHSHSLRRTTFPRRNDFLPGRRGRGLRGRGGRLSFREDDDVRDLFLSFREHLIRDERPPIAVRGPVRGIGLSGGIRRAPVKTQDSALPLRAGRSKSFDGRLLDRQFTYRDDPEVTRSILRDGRPSGIPSTRHLFLPVEDSLTRKLNRNLEFDLTMESLYADDEIPHGTKRSYSVVDEDLDFIESVNRGPLRPRFDHSGSSMRSPDEVSSAYGHFPEESVGPRGIYSARYSATRNSYGKEVWMPSVYSIHVGFSFL